MIQQLAGVLFLAKQGGQQLDDRWISHLNCKVPRCRVGSDFVVLDPLRRTNQRKVGWAFSLSFPSSMTSSPSSINPAIPLQTFALAGASAAL